ncbi:hypothetical protein D7322_14475 [Sphingobacterium puteale]|uniref:Uncharacterized protein n=1 Tax=Sphingobacterium puteale TaxID=2420510 RepID=A0A420VXB4_9SPHI|nr:hypothetical protein [Sphingobacterium puteale]RKO70877.1 hypothetical protein D7322_14475 [Sphingobacterium puteale]
MKRNFNIKWIQVGVMLLTLLTTGCSLFDMELQENYDYKHKTLDPNIGISAKKFLENRSYGTPENPTDTAFKWMRMGLEYAGIDLNELEKADRTFIFLHNDAIKIWDAKAKKVTGGLFFDFPIVTGIDGTGKPLTKPAAKWEDYNKEDVRNYFLYLILQGKYNFADLSISNVKAKTLLPANTVASKGSLLGYMNEGKGFDQEGAMYLKLVNNSDLAPIQINNKTTNRSGGYGVTNGVVHVYGVKGNTTVYPFISLQ